MVVPVLALCGVILSVVLIDQLWRVLIVFIEGTNPEDTMTDTKHLSNDEIMSMLVDQATELSTVNFEQLEADSIIKKVRGGYLVLDHDRLPYVARKMMKSLTPTKNGVRMIISKPPKSFLDLAKK